jgi:uncharacterized membrane protein YvlD (DUF360 family)
MKGLLKFLFVFSLYSVILLIVKSFTEDFNFHEIKGYLKIMIEALVFALVFVPSMSKINSMIKKKKANH